MRDELDKAYESFANRRYEDLTNLAKNVTNGSFISALLGAFEIIEQDLFWIASMLAFQEADREDAEREKAEREKAER